MHLRIFLNLGHPRSLKLRLEEKSSGASWNRIQVILKYRSINKWIVHVVTVVNLGQNQVALKSRVVLK